MKILVAEDDLSSRIMLETILTDLGYNPISVENGEDALRIMKQDDPPQIAILDWEMPKMTGIELINRLKPNQEKILPYIMLVTARNKKNDVIEGFDAGADDYLKKPYDPQELEARIKVGIRIIKAENALKERLCEIKLSEKKFRNILNNMQNIYVRCNLDGKVQLLNSFGINLLEFHEDNDKKNINFFQHILYKDSEKVKENLKEGNILSTEFEFKTTTGKILFVFGNITLLREGNDEIVGFEGSFADITTRKNMQVAKEKLEKRLNYVRKMQTIGSMVGGIAHELNNSLTPIVGYAESMHNTISEKANISKLNKILHNTEQAVDLVKKILRFDQQEENEIINFSSKELLENILQELKYEYNHIDFISIEHREDLQINGNYQNIKIAIKNILENSIESISQQAGNISLTVKSKELDRNLLEIYPYLNKRQRYLDLEIVDDGVGVENEIIDRIFEPFFTTKEKGKGLGLSEAHGIITSHKGVILTDNSLEKGMKFIVMLPIKSVKESLKEVGHKRKILFINNDKYFSEKLIQLTKSKKVELLEVQNQETELIDYYEKISEFSLIISLLKLDFGNGLEISHKIAALKQNIPFVIINNVDQKFNSKLEKDKTIKFVLPEDFTKEDFDAIIRNLE